MLGALGEVEMMETCKLLRRKAHVEVKCAKKDGWPGGPRFFIKVRMWFCVAGARDSSLFQSEQNVRVSYHFQKHWQGHVKRIYNDAFCGAGAVQCKRHVEAASSALKFPLLKEVSENCCTLDVVKFKD